MVSLIEGGKLPKPSLCETLIATCRPDCCQSGNHSSGSSKGSCHVCQKTLQLADFWGNILLTNESEAELSGTFLSPVTSGVKRTQRFVKSTHWSRRVQFNLHIVSCCFSCD